MSIYPGEYDNFTNPGPLTFEDDAGFEHDILHAKAFDAIEALEQVVGRTTNVQPGTHEGRLAALEAGGVPQGTIVMFGGDAAPAGWAFCDGTAVGRTDPAYAALFAVIGTRYGAGDGSTTFNLPDFRGALPEGVASAATAPVVKANRSHGHNASSSFAGDSHNHNVSDGGHGHSGSFSGSSHGHNASFSGSSHGHNATGTNHAHTYTQGVNGAAATTGSYNNVTIAGATATGNVSVVSATASGNVSVGTGYAATGAGFTTAGGNVGTSVGSTAGHIATTCLFIIKL